MKTTETKSVLLLRHHLKALRLPTVAAECEKVAAQAAADNADHLSYLLRLTELELLEREKRAAERRVKAARFPRMKTAGTQSAGAYGLTLILLCRQGDLEGQLHPVLGNHHPVEHETDKLLALSEVHLVKPGGHPSGEVADSSPEVSTSETAILLERGCAFQLSDPLAEGSLAGLEIAEPDGSGLIGVKQPAMLGM